MSVLALVARDGGRVLNIRTGELLDLQGATIGELADAREALTQLYYDQRAAAQLLDAEIVKRTDEAVRAGELGQYTFETPDGYKVEVDTPGKRRIDSEALRADLLNRVREGRLALSQAAIVGAFTERVSYRLNRSRFATLARQLPAIREAEELHAIPERRRATVTAPRRAPAIEATAEEVG